MSQSFWLIVIFVAAIACNADSRPQDGRNYYRSNDPNSNAEAMPQIFTAKAIPDIEEIAVVARATSDRPAPIVAEISPDAAGQMVESDVRTPPKLMEIVQGKAGNEAKKNQEVEVTTESGVVVDRIQANGRFELPDASERASSLPYVASEGKGNQPKKKDEDQGVKGIAVPVLMDEVDVESTTPAKKLQKIPEIKPVKEEKKKTNPKPMQNPTTTPSSGLSTWILLSDNRESTTVLPKKSNKKETAKPEKIITTTKKPMKAQSTTTKPIRTGPAKTTSVTKKGNVTPKPEMQNENMSALEAMVKNQKKNTQPVNEMTTAKMPPQKKPTTTVKPTRINDRMDGAEAKTELAEGKRPSTIPPTLLMATQNPTTIALSDQQGNGQTTTEPTVETTTKKKKNGTKKKKKNKTRRRKPSNGTATQIEQKTNVIKNSKQPVGAQFYNFLSREIMPTVGLGLVGVLVTAGLAGLLGYNPFVSGNLPVRRTYEIQHGYSPNSYYSYNAEYSDGGQSEEALFREVLSGMPEGSRYGLTNTENSYPEAQIYNSQDQVYDSMKGQTDKKYQNTDNDGQYHYPDTKKEDETSSYDAVYSQDYSGTYAAAAAAAAVYDSPEVLKNRDNSDKYPMYDREVSASYVYPEVSQPEKSSRLNEEYDPTGQYSETPGRYGSDKISSKYSKTKTDTIERQPEALYRVAGDYEHPYRGESTIQGVTSQNSWHRIGSAMDYRKFSHLEPGPRSLNFTKDEVLKSETAKKRTKRDDESVIQRIARRQNAENAEKDAENEIDSDDDTKNRDPIPTTERADTFTEDMSNPTTEADYDVIDGNPTYNFLDVLKRLAQYKLKMGLSFLRSTTDAFSRYLDVIQKRVDESITNTTLVYRIRRNPDVKIRRRRATEMKKRIKKMKKDKLKKSLKKN